MFLPTSSCDEAIFLAALQGVLDPHLGLNLVAGKLVKSMEVTVERVKLVLKFGYPIKGYEAELREEVQSAFSPLLNGKQLDIEITCKINSHATQKEIKNLPNVKNIIAVASGKGGVGKSTTAVNLALALLAEGAEVGILDADIYGPSQPWMLGTKETPRVIDQKQMLPIMSHGLPSMSMGYLVANESPMIWRGPMVSSALMQLLTQTAWEAGTGKALDYLIVDLPPGTGDIQLTLAQKIPVSGAVIVTTPQDIALLDAKKAVEMFRKLGIAVLGVVENMSYHICRKCGEVDSIFGAAGGEAMAAQFEVPLLAKVPLETVIRADSDAGVPTVVSQPESAVANIYKQLARRVGAQLSQQPRDYRAQFPTIVIENT